VEKTSEQREHVRFEVKWEVEVSAADWDDVLTLTTTSVSRGGLYICTARPAHVGASVSVTLKLPDDNIVKLTGEVVRTVNPEKSDSPGFALRFDPAESSDLLLLESMASAFGSPEGGDPSKRRSSIKASVITREVRAEEGTIQLDPDSAPPPTGEHKGQAKDQKAKSPSLTGVPAVEFMDTDAPSAFGPQPTVPRTPSKEELESLAEGAEEPEEPEEKEEPEAKEKQTKEGLGDVPDVPVVVTASPKTPDSEEEDLEAGSYDVGEQIAAALSGDIVESPVSPDSQVPGKGEGGWVDDEDRKKKKKEARADDAKEEGDADAISVLPPLVGEEEPQRSLTDDIIPITEGHPTGELAKPPPADEPAKEPTKEKPKEKITRESPAVKPTVEAPEVGGATAQAPSVRTLTPAPHDLRHTLPPISERRGGDESQAFGIDFGTSYTSVGLFYSGEVAVLEDDEGHPLVPSAVSYPEQGDPVVGWKARERMATNPSTTFTSPKRLVGRHYDDHNIAPFITHSAVRYERGPDGQIVADVYGYPVTVIQVCTEVFRHIARVGEDRSGRPVGKVVLAAPVGFEDYQRNAIARAAKLAGLETVAIIDEPVAAAIAFGASGDREQLIAVYDFGGGTFDFTLLQAGGGTFEVLAEAGDAWLGGDDFDLALANYTADQFHKQKKIDLRKRQVEWQRLLFLCEAAKRRLSREEETVIEATGIALSLKGAIDLKVGLNRTLFVDLCRELVERSLETVETAFMLSGHEPHKVEQVVMTGGVSRIPMVRERVQQFFNQPVELTINPEEAICAGAARFARQASGVYREG
jgi:actin-like ATPase involved in cell morphogenesis